MAFVGMSVRCHSKCWAFPPRRARCHRATFFRGEGAESTHRARHAKKSEILPIGMEAVSDHSYFVFPLCLSSVFLSPASYVLT